MKNKINFENLTFSFTKTKSMYVSKCKINEEWDLGKLFPFSSLSISPASTILNYGQGLFEGLKAYKTKDNQIIMFRPEENAKRAANGCLRLSMPKISEKVFLHGVKSIVKDNSQYIPKLEEGSLYIRPLIFGSGENLGVSPSSEYTFVVFCSPVGPYFKSGLKPIKLIVNNDYHRAPSKGTGGVKAVGNYASGMLPSMMAKNQGFAEVVYLDANEEKYVEEVGAANFFSIKGNSLITPKLTGSILPGITRDSVLFLAKNRLGMNIEERKISIQEVLKSDEVFCTGTAAIIAPIKSINYKEKDYIFSKSDTGLKTRQIFDILTRIQSGEDKNEYGWITRL